MLAAVATRGLRDGPLEAGLDASARPRGGLSVRGGARKRGEADGESGDSGCRWPTLRQRRLVSRLSDAATVRGVGATHNAMGYARRGLGRRWTPTLGGLGWGGGMRVKLGGLEAVAVVGGRAGVSRPSEAAPREQSNE